MLEKRAPYPAGGYVKSEVQELPKRGKGLSTELSFLVAGSSSAFGLAVHSDYGATD
jgi:hypothetical protein